ncbi:MAG TPA: phosphoglycerate dehydrogenase [Gemmataceae bacterium]|nr:phosphoglycerate dehydrogenase [Gemmataceae bacterium]
MDKVLIAPMTLANLEGKFVQVLREAGFELIYPKQATQLTEDELLAILPGIKASLAGSEPYTARVLAAHPSLRVIARAGVGYDAVDLPAATRQGVAVTITPGTNEGSVAEHTFSLLLGLVKNLVPQHLSVKTGGWPRGANLPLRGRTLGIAGLGRIGKAVAVRGAAFGMRLIAYDPFPDTAFAAHHDITLVSLERLLAESDYVTLHLPVSAESRYLINRKTLALMKPTAFLINTARGAVVNEADLLEALQNKRLAGAGLDVFEAEPPGEHPLFQMDNVLLTPHAAGTDVQSRDDMALSAAQAIVSLSRGEWPAEKVVNAEARAHYRW